MSTKTEPKLATTREAQLWLDGCLADCDHCLARERVTRAVGVYEHGAEDLRTREALCLDHSYSPMVNVERVDTVR